MKRAATLISILLIAGCSDAGLDVIACDQNFLHMHKENNLDFKTAKDKRSFNKQESEFVRSCMVKKGYSLDVEAQEEFLHNIYHHPDSSFHCSDDLMQLRDPAWQSTCHAIKMENRERLLLRGEYWIMPISQRIKLLFR